MNTSPVENTAFDFSGMNNNSKMDKPKYNPPGQAISLNNMNIKERDGASKGTSSGNPEIRKLKGPPKP